MTTAVAVRVLDFSDLAHRLAFLDLLDHYALDPMGGGHGLSETVRATLVAALSEVRNYHGALAWQGDEAIGLINCFIGFSTFAAAPLLNVHDLVVRQDRRGAGIGTALLAHAECLARELGCCKITLEVLSGNMAAQTVYQRVGYRPYVLDPRAGHAVLLEKRL